MLQTGSHSAKNQLVWRKHGVKGNMGCMRLMYRRKHILFLLLCATTVWLIYHIFTFTSGNCIEFFDNVYMLTRISSIFSWLCWRFSVEQCLCGRWYRSICQFYAEIRFFCDSLLSELKWLHFHFKCIHACYIFNSGSYASKRTVNKTHTKTKASLIQLYTVICSILLFYLFTLSKLCIDQGCSH